MKHFITILIFCITCSLLYGQDFQRSKNVIFHPCDSIPGLLIIDSLPLKEIIGELALGDGYGGSHFALYSNRRFKRTDFNCWNKDKIQTGSWNLNDSKTLSLTTNKNRLDYSIFKIDNLYFFIPSEKTLNFLKEVSEAKGNAAKIDFDNLDKANFYLLKNYLHKYISITHKNFE